MYIRRVLTESLETGTSDDGHNTPTVGWNQSLELQVVVRKVRCETLL